MGSKDIAVLEDMSMEELLKESSPENQVGSVVTATVVDNGPQGLLVDVGLKVEGLVPSGELRAMPEPPAPGASFPVVIKRMNGPDGHPLVSWREARERIYWDKIVEAQQKDLPVDAKVARRIKGGLLVDIGVEGFLPASQIDRKPVKDIDGYVGQTLKVSIITIEPRKKNVVVSRRRLLDKEAEGKRQDTLKTIKEGDLLTGRVVNLTDFGAFLDIGGVEGLLRTQDLSWNRTEKPSQILKLGEEVPVKVLKFEPDTGKISLGRKQLMAHPWEGIEEKYPPGQVVEGQVTNLSNFGAFVSLAPGVEGLIHQSEFSWSERWAKPENFLKEGQKISVYVISADRANEKLSLSLKRAGQNPWEEAKKQFPKGTRVKGTVTHMVAFGAFVKLPNGIEGLLRNADFFWTKFLSHSKDVLAEGQEIEVVVLEVDVKSERVALGLKQTRPDPFTTLKPGAMVSGKVKELLRAGVVVEIDFDVEGYLDIREMPKDLAEKEISQVFTEGQDVTCSVKAVQKKTRKIELSVRLYERKQERELLRKYQPGKPITLGEVTQWERTAEDDPTSQ